MSCKEGIDIQRKQEFEPKKEVAKNIGRSSWQKPDLVIQKLGNIEGKKIADIGAGTGYFSYRLAYAGAEVIAIDVDPDMISLMDGFITNLPKDISSKVETRLAKFDDPLLFTAEIDAAIIINTITYIEDKIAYLKILKNGLKEGYVMIVDYKKIPIDISAPPLEERISSSEIQKILSDAGYKEIEVDDTTLEYQYIITGSK